MPSCAKSLSHYVPIRYWHNTLLSKALLSLLSDTKGTLWTLGGPTVKGEVVMTDECRHYYICAFLPHRTGDQARNLKPAANSSPMIVLASTISPCSIMIRARESFST